jgi:6-pyruvoyltetrahydropterin/6-carboxytetrahydropterin synthase
MSRFTVGVLREFIASHFLVGGDWGRENELHAHHYRLEAIFAGDELDRYGYLLDIAVVKEHLDALVGRIRDRSLNDLPELAGKNPGLEPFARLLAEGLARTLVPALRPGALAALTIKLWENEEAFATYTLSPP